MSDDQGAEYHAEDAERYGVMLLRHLEKEETLPWGQTTKRFFFWDCANDRHLRDRRVTRRKAKGATKADTQKEGRERWRDVSEGTWEGGGKQEGVSEAMETRTCSSRNFRKESGRGRLRKMRDRKM